MKRRQRSAALSLLLLGIIFIVGILFGRRFMRAVPMRIHHDLAPEPTLMSPSPNVMRVSPPATTRALPLASRGFVQSLLPLPTITLLNRQDSMINLSHRVQLSCDSPPNEKESSSNYEFLQVFGDMLREKFDNLPWWLDEGGLIGSSRAGAMTNADDDFDFFIQSRSETFSLSWSLDVLISAASSCRC
ncbi:unnamed protein product [Bodo saltans]|uniref:Uncharacterized protein n=1 Tax=Bodo saltans TaxID=75058 RepID=A0A0S4KMX3_BODSA|nr:unnamed protein product [Bodo saltans]|eukprot:CUI15005.1 unnamed protein product [Bodo saltans]